MHKLCAIDIPVGSTTLLFKMVHFIFMFWDIGRCILQQATWNNHIWRCILQQAKMRNNLRGRFSIFFVSGPSKQMRRGPSGIGSVQTDEEGAFRYRVRPNRWGGGLQVSSPSKQRDVAASGQGIVRRYCAISRWCANSRYCANSH